MIRTLVALPSREDLEYAGLSLLIQTRKRQFERAQSEYVALEVALANFTSQVRHRIGDLKDEMRLVRAEVEELRKRAARLREDPDADPAEIEREVAEEIEAERQREESGEYDFIHPDRRPDSRIRSPQLEAEVLRLYRELAKRFHPDLAANLEERSRRADLMLQINVAFRDRDLALLQSMINQHELAEPVTGNRQSVERLAWAKNELARLEREIAATNRNISKLRTSDTFAYWQTPEAAEEALNDLEQKTRERLDRELGRLAQARDAYRKLALRRKKALRMRKVSPFDQTPTVQSNSAAASD